MTPLSQNIAPEIAPTDPEQWVDLYADALYGYALYRTANSAIAEELVQETFMAALTALKSGTFHGDSSPQTWLTGILKHKIMDHFRQKYRHQTQSLDFLREDDIEEYFDAKGNWKVKPGSWGENPQKKYEQQELMHTLLECIKTLGERQADAFRLRELEGEEAKEICKVLQISATNYWVLMHRARLSMRRCMESHWSHETLQRAPS